jgi:hypothetical protein
VTSGPTLSRSGWLTYLDLVRSDDIVEVVGLQEAACDVRPELTTHASLARGPSVHRLKGSTKYKKSAFLENNRKGQ